MTFHHKNFSSKFVSITHEKSVRSYSTFGYDAYFITWPSGQIKILLCWAEWVITCNIHILMPRCNHNSHPTGVCITYNYCHIHTHILALCQIRWKENWGLQSCKPQFDMHFSENMGLVWVWRVHTFLKKVNWATVTS